MAMIRCTGCGRSLPDTAVGCGNCGRPVGFEPAPYVPVEDLPPLPPLPPMATQLPLFPVATHKFVVLSICTFGIYVAYWCYQNWVRIRYEQGPRSVPLLLAFTAPVSSYWLFRHIRAVAAEHEIAVGWQPAALAVLYFVMSALGNLPDGWWLLGVLSVLPLIPVHQATVRINDQHAARVSEDRNTSYSGANLAAIVVGGTVLLTAVATVFIGEDLNMKPDRTGPESVDAYIADAPAEARRRLTQMRRAIKAAAPGAAEKMSYGIPTFTLDGPLVHYAAFTHHVGFYPGASGIARFARELRGFSSGKGSVQFPLDQPLPLDLVTTIVTFRVRENTARAAAKAATQTPVRARRPR